MASLSETQLLHVLLALGVTLLAARGFGEIARRLGLPEVLGQLVAGVALGPSLLGPVLPGVYDALFGDPPAANGLSAVSWLGALLIFLTAGTEADLRVLRVRARSGLLIATGAIVPSLVAGTLLGWLVLGQEPIAGLFLGVAMSVTAVSVLVAILDERGAMRRDYGQVLLAAGVTTEMTVWVFIPVVSALLHGSPSPVVAALVALAGVVGVFLFMLTAGQAVTHQALRWVADRALIARSPISVILVVTLLAAALTEALGLHPLLGAFAAGMVLVRAPRVRPPLLQSVQTLTTGFLAPIFFAFAGTRVNLRELGGWPGVLDVVVVAVVAGAVKIGGAYAMSRLTGLARPDGLLVGLGMNLKGGTDVIVALVGTELGFFPNSVYSVYGAASILTVLASAPALSRLDARIVPSDDETSRLRRESARSSGYLSGLERVLVASPAGAPLLADVVGSLAGHRQLEGQPFDTVTERVGADAAGQRVLREAVTRVDLVAAALPGGAAEAVQRDDALDVLLASGSADLLVTVAPDGRPSPEEVRTILVPFDGRPPSLDAVDLALAIARQHGATVVPLRVRAGRDHHRPSGGDTDDGAATMDTVLQERSATVPPVVRSMVATAPDVEQAIRDEVARGGHDLLVLGTTAHRATSRSRLGRTVDALIDDVSLPTVVLVRR